MLRLLGEGLTNAEIAARLYISTKTVAIHVSNLFAKLQPGTGPKPPLSPSAISRPRGPTVGRVALQTRNR